MVDTRLHQTQSLTYGGRNSPQQIAGDAKDLRAAAERDLAAYRPHFEERGFQLKRSIKLSK
ncbi:hypothetical protein WMF18_41620 [Sorangium sp. So ce315]|uniref:hypothetical protein n=1 Tax=Sorangium sp. So ce315 TaxID=3133299 RepID=UPI003F631522